MKRQKSKKHKRRVGDKSLYLLGAVLSLFAATEQTQACEFQDNYLQRIVRTDPPTYVYINESSLSGTDRKGNNNNALMCGVIAYGSPPPLTLFSNRNGISVSAIIGDADTGRRYNASSVSVFLRDMEIQKLENFGLIEAKSFVGSTRSGVLVAGSNALSVGRPKSNTTYINSGRISAFSGGESSAGEFSGIDLFSTAVDINRYRISTDPFSINFTNTRTGIIEATSSLQSVDGGGPRLSATGGHFEGKEVNLLNEGKIVANTSINSITSITSVLYMSASSVSAKGNLINLTNRGSIIANTNNTNVSEGIRRNIFDSIGAYGVGLNADETNLTNDDAGEIKVHVDTNLMASSYARAVYLAGGRHNLLNRGTIRTEIRNTSMFHYDKDTSPLGYYIANINGVLVYSGSSLDFKNYGTLEVNTTIQNIDRFSLYLASLTHYFFQNANASILNENLIKASLKVGNISQQNRQNTNIEVAGIYLGYYKEPREDHRGDVADIVNKGNIEVTAEIDSVTGGEVNSSATSVYVYTRHTNFTNSGTIKSTVNTGSVNSNAIVHTSAYGLVAKDGYAFNYTNTSSGSIETYATVGSATNGSKSAVSAQGVETLASSLFYNEGVIRSDVRAGNSDGDGSGIRVYARGVRARVHTSVSDDDNLNFKNTGRIESNLTAGGVANGGNYDVDMRAVELHARWSELYGAKIKNEGLVKSKAFLGDVDGSGSSLSSSVGALHFWIWRAKEHYFLGTNSSTVEVVSIHGNVKNGGSLDTNVSAISFKLELADNFRFENDSDIRAVTNVGNVDGNNSRAVAKVKGVDNLFTYYTTDFAQFNNKGSIEALLEAGNSTNGGVTEVDVRAFDSSISYLENYFQTNENLIEANTKIGNSTGINSRIQVNTIGLNIHGDYLSFSEIHTVNLKNTGVIGAKITAGSASNGGSLTTNATGAYIYARGRNVILENIRDIKVDLSVDVVSGENSRTEAQATGVYLSGAIVNFKNTGNVESVVIAKDSTDGIVTLEGGKLRISSKVVDIQAGEVRRYSEDIGYYTEIGRVNFSNEGTINANVSVGNVAGENSSVKLNQLAALQLHRSMVESAVNSGNLSVNIKAGSGAEIGASVFEGNNLIGGYVAGIMLKEVSQGTFINSGQIKIKVDAPQARSVENVAGIYILGSTNITLSSPGPIYLSNNAPNADIRTLRIEGSNVTLQDAFSIVFGQPGVEKEPIYVGSGSTLNLNNADLVVYAGTNLRFNQPYRLIENIGGTVNGTWGNLRRGFLNDEIQVNWYGNKEGVEFSQQPTQPPPSADGDISFEFTPQPNRFLPFTASASASSSTIVNNVIMELGFNPIIGGVLGRTFGMDSNGNNTLVASTSSLIPKSKTQRRAERGSVFVFPFYSYISAGSIGFNSKGGGAGFGVDFSLSENVKAALYGAYAQTDIDYKRTGAIDGDQKIYGAGFYIDYSKKPIYVSFTSFGYAADNKYTGLTGPNFQIFEKADFWSRGIDAKLIGGYVMSGDNWIFMPNVGIGYRMSKADSYTTKASNPNWNRQVRSDTISYAIGYIGAMAGRVFSFGDTKLYLTGLLRLEQAFGDNDSATTQSIPALGSGEIKVEREIANATVRGRLELEYRVKERYGVGITGETALNSNYKSYGGRLTFRWFF